MKKNTELLYDSTVGSEGIMLTLHNENNYLEVEVRGSEISGNELEDTIHIIDLRVAGVQGILFSAPRLKAEITARFLNVINACKKRVVIADEKSLALFNEDMLFTYLLPSTNLPASTHHALQILMTKRDDVVGEKTDVDQEDSFSWDLVEIEEE